MVYRHVQKVRDLADVDWATVHYTFSADQSWGQPTAAAQHADPVATTTAAPVVTTTAPAISTTNEHAHVNSEADSVANGIESAVGTVASDVASTTSTFITEADTAVLSALGALTGINSKESSAGIWVGDDGDFTLEVSNTGSEDVVLIGWGSQGSWVNVKQPAITVSLPQNEKVTLSFSSGQSGALSAVYSDTKLINGQVSNTWAEFTFESEYSTVDISREVLMSGHTMEVVTPQCTTNMDTCVFVCESGETCTTGYSLKNCAIGSQAGANTDSASQNGGCSGFETGANLTMTLS